MKRLRMLARQAQDPEALQGWVQETPVQGRLMAQAGEEDMQRWLRRLVGGLSQGGLVRTDEAGVRLLG